MRFGEYITEICDSTNNEVRMETALSELKKTWSTMKFPKLLVLNVPKNCFELSKKTRLLFRTIFHQRTFRSSDSHSTNGSRSSKLLNKSSRFGPTFNITGLTFVQSSLAQKISESSFQSNHNHSKTLISK